MSSVNILTKTPYNYQTAIKKYTSKYNASKESKSPGAEKYVETKNKIDEALKHAAYAAVTESTWLRFLNVISFGTYVKNYETQLKDCINQIYTIGEKSKKEKTTTYKVIVSTGWFSFSKKTEEIIFELPEESRAPIPVHTPPLVAKAVVEEKGKAETFAKPDSITQFIPTYTKIKLGTATKPDATAKKPARIVHTSYAPDKLVEHKDSKLITALKQKLIKDIGKEYQEKYSYMLSGEFTNLMKLYQATLNGSREAAKINTGGAYKGYILPCVNGG